MRCSVVEPPNLPHAVIHRLVAAVVQRARKRLQGDMIALVVGGRRTLIDMLGDRGTRRKARYNHPAQTRSTDTAHQIQNGVSDRQHVPSPIGNDLAVIDHGGWIAGDFVEHHPYIVRLGVRAGRMSGAKVVFVPQLGMHGERIHKRDNIDLGNFGKMAHG